MHQGSWQRTLIIYAGSLVLLVAMTALDWLTGPEVHSELFFVIPVIVAAYWLRRRHVIVMSLLCTAGYMVADQLVTRAEHWAVDAFQALSSLAELLVIGLAVAAVRRERDALRAANARISQLLENESRLARTDNLTGLANLREFQQRLQLDLARAERDGTLLSLLLIDLDNFKRVNDRFGHPDGDRALCGVADVLRTHTRASDLAARIGGDEFALLLWHAGEDDARLVARRVADEIAALAANWPGTDLGASVGVVMLPRDAADPESALKRADTAMYDAKRAGRSRQA
ncbi:MAG: GGDEF domain-containing protein [Planctomycetes bacterium]|jgi:diguanylate cyclase (GGDEF)-like protein|nr:GGDEF domain-containing protein [Planctomycetota bacterium]MCL4731759.1 GGDEF domain-containing protein [Planctomycetota bacterium]